MAAGIMQGDTLYKSEIMQDLLDKVQKDQYDKATLCFVDQN